MIFTFPALVSEHVDKRLLPGILKTLESYYLHHIIDAILSNNLKFKIEINSTGNASNVKVESALLDSSKEILNEGLHPYHNLLTSGVFGPKAVEDKDVMSIINTLNDIAEERLGLRQNPKSIEDIDKRDRIWSGKFRDALAKAVNRPDNPTDDKGGKYLVDKYIKQLEKSSSQTLSSDPKIKIQPVTDMGFVPTLVTIPINVEIVDRRVNDSYHQMRPMIIGVKILPVVAKNFNSMYQMLRDDYYANIVRYQFKSLTRGILRAMYSSYVVKTLKKYYEYIFGTLSPDEVGDTKWDWYFSILLSKKALVNAGGFKKMPTGLPNKQYASAIVIMNKDEKEDMFADPKKVHRLFLMGWNTFLIMDDREKQATMCSSYDRGKCTTVPYSFLYRQIDADQIYKDYEDLNSKGRGAFFRKMKSGFKMKRLARESEQYINEKFEEYNNAIKRK